MSVIAVSPDGDRYKGDKSACSGKTLPLETTAPNNGELKFKNNN